jgi:hypothetical protein
MKNFLIFVSGMITMFIMVVIFGIVMSSTSNSGYPGLTLFEEDGKCINAKQLQVFQVVEPNMALSHAKTKPNEIYDPNELLVLLIGSETTSYYDDQKINVPKGKRVKQIGTYQYEAKMGMKTVPAVEIK